MPYTITLSDEQARVLMDQVEAIENQTRRAILAIQRKRSWRESERAMACVSLQTRLRVLNDCLRAQLKRQQ